MSASTKLALYGAKRLQVLCYKGSWTPKNRNPSKSFADAKPKHQARLTPIELRQQLKLATIEGL